MLTNLFCGIRLHFYVYFLLIVSNYEFLSPGSNYLVLAINCYVGYGQRGLEYTKGIQWARSCPLTKYCFEVVTSDIKKVQKLIDYPWDSVR